MSRLSKRFRRRTDKQLRKVHLVLENLEDRSVPSAVGGFTQVNIASDVPGLAKVVDPYLVNPWGMSFSPTGPFWCADHDPVVSDVLDGAGNAVPLLTAIPAINGGTSRPTG